MDLSSVATTSGFSRASYGESSPDTFPTCSRQSFATVSGDNRLRLRSQRKNVGFAVEDLQIALSEVESEESLFIDGETTVPSSLYQRFTIYADKRKKSGRHTLVYNVFGEDILVDPIRAKFFREDVTEYESEDEYDDESENEEYEEDEVSEVSYESEYDINDDDDEISVFEIPEGDALMMFTPKAVGSLRALKRQQEQEEGWSSWLDTLASTVAVPVQSLFARRGSMTN